MPDQARTTRRVALALSTLACALAAARCDGDEHPRRFVSHGVPGDLREADAYDYGDGALPGLPPDPNPAIVHDAPEDIGSSICPGTRLYRVNRRHVGAPASAPALTPRFFGRDEYGRFMTFTAVLLCELRVFNWVIKHRDEGMNLVLWRGPYIFEPDGDCDWREPVHDEAFEGGRRLFLREHCRRRSHPAPMDRQVVIEVDRSYTHIIER